MADVTFIQVKNSFDFLIKQYGFRIIKQEVSESFGNSILIAETNDIRVKFITDRGDLCITIGPCHGIDEWFELSVVRAFVTGSDLLMIYEIDDAVNFFRQYFPMIKEIFGPDKVKTTVNQLKELGKKRVYKMFPQA